MSSLYGITIDGVKGGGVGDAESHGRGGGGDSTASYPGCVGSN